VTTAWRLERRPGLDGLRGIAILLVLSCHLFSVETGANDRWHAVGSAGVELFFALSGFLITCLLLEERASTGGISLVRFYDRRARRLLPALAVVVVFALAVGASIGVDLAPSVLPVLLYVANWAQASGANLGALDTTWSLAIEEQFYLVWPLVLIGVSRWRRGPLLLASGGIVVSLGLRWAISDGSRVYYGSDTQAGPILVGVVLACLATSGLQPWRVRPIVPFVLAVGCAAFVFTDAPWVGDRLVPTVVPCLGAAAIWMACCSAGGPLEWGWLRWVGRRSYALYLWHMPMLLLVWLIHPSVLEGLGGLMVTFALAEMSWRLVERPMLRRASVPSRTLERV
jgi:peptidoglycan/LPS O-acetylase OafA/YrhL